jgi:hypothetical protein
MPALLKDLRYAEIRRLSHRYEEVTGKQGFLYPSDPGDQPIRFVFGAMVVHGIGHALRYARTLGAYADLREREAAAAAARTAQYEQMKDIT